MSGAQRTRRPSARIQLSPKQANITLGVGRKTPACPGLKHLVTDFVKPNVPGVRSWIHGRQAFSWATAVMPSPCPLSPHFDQSRQVFT
jgi:hypothetical protein